MAVWVFMRFVLEPKLNKAQEHFQGHIALPPPSGSCRPRPKLFFFSLSLIPELRLPADTRCTHLDIFIFRVPRSS